MPRKLHILTRTGFLMGLFIAFAAAQNHYILNAPAGNIDDVCKRNGLQLVSALPGSAHGLYVVNSPLPPSSVIQALQHESSVKSVEQDQSLALPERSKSASPALGGKFGANSVAAAIAQFGSAGYSMAPWGAYLNQSAASLIRVPQAHQLATGAGTVAILDTGVDFTNPVIRGSLVTGYDFVNRLPGGQTFPIDLNQSTTSILDQSTTSILDQSTTSILDANSTIILDQSTTSILDQSTTSILDGTKPLNDWGHGTMVAGIIHLVAPTAKLMPVKVFDAHGGSSVSLIVQGIHYAVDHGARVINMSFSMVNFSQSLQDAIDYASAQGVILVAAAGNEGQSMTVYPAGYPPVIGVAATDDNGERAPFSNYGSVVTVAAPGTGVISTYPMSQYAAGWGTSFSAPMVSGAAALFVDLDPGISVAEARKAITRARPLHGQQLGAGLLDLVQALSGLTGH
jgi:subtilisin family serine protease